MRQYQKPFTAAYLCKDTETEHNKKYLDVDIEFALSLNTGDKIWFDKKHFNNIKYCRWAADTQKNYEEWKGIYLITDQIFVNDSTIIIKVELQAGFWQAPY